MKQLKTLEYDVDSDELERDFFERVSSDQIQNSIDLVVDEFQKEEGTIFDRMNLVVDKKFSKFLVSIIENIEKRSPNIHIFLLSFSKEELSKCFNAVYIALMLEKKSKHIPIRRGAFIGKDTTRNEDHQYVSEIVYKMFMLMSPSYEHKLSEHSFNKKKIDIIRLEIKDALLGSYDGSIFDDIDVQDTSMKDASYLIYAAFSYTESRHKGVQYCQGLVREKKISGVYGEALINYLVSHNKITSKHPHKSLLPVGAIVVKRDAKNIGMYLDKHMDSNTLEVKIVEKKDNQFVVLSTATKKIEIEQFLDQGEIILPEESSRLIQRNDYEESDKKVGSELQCITKVAPKDQIQNKALTSLGKALVTINDDEDEISDQPFVLLEDLQSEEEREAASMEVLEQALLETPAGSAKSEFERLADVAAEEDLKDIKEAMEKKVEKLKNPDAFVVPPQDLNMLRIAAASNITQKSQLLFQKVKVKIMYRSLTSSEQIFEEQEVKKIKTKMTQRIRSKVFEKIWQLPKGKKIICTIP
jgi:hypothetical protein